MNTIYYKSVHILSYVLCRFVEATSKLRIGPTWNKINSPNEYGCTNPRLIETHLVGSVMDQLGGQQYRSKDGDM
jgi:hypothetical protein